jgi:hypothetical protein
MWRRAGVASLPDQCILLKFHHVLPYYIALYLAMVRRCCLFPQFVFELSVFPRSFPTSPSFTDDSLHGYTLFQCNTLGITNGYNLVFAYRVKFKSILLSFPFAYINL